jgi:hypothetical protein
MIEPPSRQRLETFFRPAARAAAHQNRLDDTLKKGGSPLAVVGSSRTRAERLALLPRIKLIELSSWKEFLYHFSQ